MAEEKLPPKPYMKWAHRICGGNPAAIQMLIALSEFTNFRLDADGRRCAVRSLEWWAEYTGYSPKQVQKAIALLHEKKVIYKRIGVNPFNGKTCLWIRFRHKLYEKIILKKPIESSPIGGVQSSLIREDQSYPIGGDRRSLIGEDLYNIIISNDIDKERKKREKINTRTKIAGGINPLKRVVGKNPEKNLGESKLRKIQKKEMQRKGKDVAKHKTGKSFDDVLPNQETNFDFGLQKFQIQWKRIHSKYFPEEFIGDWVDKEKGYAKVILQVLKTQSGFDSQSAIKMVDEIMEQWDDVCYFIGARVWLETQTQIEIPYHPTVGFLSRRLQDSKTKHIHLALEFIADPETGFKVIERGVKDVEAKNG